MVDRQRSDGADELREHDDGQSLLGRADSDAATCGCIPVMRAVAARDVERHDGAGGGPPDGGARDRESSHARTPDFEPAVSSDCETPDDAAAAGVDRASGISDSPLSARLPAVAASACADSPRARQQPLDDPPRSAEIDGCTVGVTLEPPSHDASVAAEPKPPVAKLPRTSIAEVRSPNLRVFWESARPRRPSFPPSRAMRTLRHAFAIRSRSTLPPSSAVASPSTLLKLSSPLAASATERSSSSFSLSASRSSSPSPFPSFPPSSSQSRRTATSATARSCESCSAPAARATCTPTRLASAVAVTGATAAVAAARGTAAAVAAWRDGRKWRWID
ncbi:unnamed protein product [Closterium sp. NIES-53]